MVKPEEELAEPGLEQDSQRVRVGHRLRRLRRLRGLTLEQVASEVDLSHSFLSMLERGQADISLSRFTRLAAFYGIRASELLLEEEATNEPEISLPDDGLVIDRGPGITYRLLTPDAFGGQVIHATFEPQSAFKDVLAHKGRDLVWVLKGEVVLLYGDQDFVVRESQLISYEAATPHTFRNDSDRPAEILGFATLPYW